MTHDKKRISRRTIIGMAAAIMAAVAIGLYAASNYMLNFSILYPKDKRGTAET